MKHIKFHAASLAMISLTSFGAYADKVIYFNQRVIERSQLDAVARREKDGAVSMRFGTVYFGNKIFCSGKVDDDTLYKKVLPELAAYLDKEKLIHPFEFARRAGLTDCKQVQDD